MAVIGEVRWLIHLLIKNFQTLRLIASSQTCSESGIQIVLNNLILTDGLYHELGWHNRAFLPEAKRSQNSKLSYKTKSIIAKFSKAHLEVNRINYNVFELINFHSTSMRSMHGHYPSLK